MSKCKLKSLYQMSIKIGLKCVGLKLEQSYNQHIEIFSEYKVDNLVQISDMMCPTQLAPGTLS